MYLTQPSTDVVFLVCRWKMIIYYGPVKWISYFSVRLSFIVGDEQATRSETRSLESMNGGGITVGDLVDEIRTWAVIEKPPEWIEKRSMLLEVAGPECC